MSIFKKLIIPVLSTFLALAPLKSQSQSLSFHIGDMLNKQNYTEIGSSLEGINITLEDLSNNQTIAELTTDEHGNARYNFTGIIEPNYNINFNEIRSVRVFDLTGRLEETHYGNNFREKPNKPSGMRFYLLEDIYENKKAMKSLNIENEVRNGIIIPAKSEIQKYGKKEIASTDELRNIRLIISDPDTAYFRFIDTLNVDDNQNYDLNLDLFPNIELEWPENWDQRPYRNFLHFLKKILYLTDEDIINNVRTYYHYRWPSFPISLFPNDEDAPNDNYRNAIRDFEEDVSNISYGEHSHDFVDLVDEAPDSLGGEYDFSQEASWFRIYERRNGDGLYYPLRSRIYVNNNTMYPKRPTYHESLNQLVIGRDSANPIDVQHAGGPTELSSNDELLIISVKNIPPHYRKLLNHRELNQ